MEGNDVPNTEIVNDKSSAHLLKRALQFLVSISLLSLLLCYSFFPHSFNVCYFSFSAYPIDRKYMFVVCNGILVFLAKSSSSRSSSSPLFDLEAKSSPTTDHMETSVGDQLDVIGSVDDGTVTIVPEDQEHKGEADLTEAEGGDEDQEENESEDLLAGQEDTERVENGAVMNKEIQDMEAPDAPIEEELLSTDELNKKIEEFIRKMKEEIRIEAQQQLIAV